MKSTSIIMYHEFILFVTRKKKNPKKRLQVKKQPYLRLREPVASGFPGSIFRLGPLLASINHPSNQLNK